MPDAYEQIVNDIQSNVDYDIEGSIPKCRAFVSACRKFLALGLVEAESVNDHNVRLNPSVIQRQLDDAIKWLTANGGMSGQGPTTGYTKLDLQDFRG